MNNSADTDILIFAGIVIGALIVCAIAVAWGLWELVSVL